MNSPHRISNSGCFVGVRASGGFLLFGFFKHADANLAPGAYRFTAVSAPDETVIGRVVRDDEFVVTAIATPEGTGPGMVLARPFCPALFLGALSNLVFFRARKSFQHSGIRSLEFT